MDPDSAGAAPDALDPGALLAEAERHLAASEPRAAQTCLRLLLDASAEFVPEMRARTLILAAWTERVLGQSRDRQRFLDESRAVLDRHRLLPLESIWRLEAMLWSLRRGELGEAEHHGCAALAAARWSVEGSELAEARATANLARISMARGEWSSAVRRLQTAAAYFRECGDHDRLSQFRKDLARCLYHQGKWDEATAVLQKALAWFAESGDGIKEAHSWTALAMVAVAAGDLPAASESAGRADNLAGPGSPPRTRALVEEVRGDIAAAGGDGGRALEHYDRALASLGSDAVSPDVVTEVLHRRAVVLLRLARPEESLADAERSLMIAREASERVEEAAALRALGMARAALGAVRDARGNLESALAIAAECGERLEEARTCEALGHLMLGASESGPSRVEATSYLYRARSLFAALGCARDVARVDRWLADNHDHRGRPRRPPGSWLGRVAPRDLQFISGDPRVLSDIERLRRVPDRVLLVGETGTGKELIARKLHVESERHDGPFIVVDCAAVARGLFESELFGHCRGTFTGASWDRKGLVESAHGGTLFLDEIAELSLEMQSRLLRVVQERQARRLGENEYRNVDFRLIAATNRDIVRMVEEGRFRSDLYFRLRGAMMIIPPLRERPGDILLIAEHVIRRLSLASGRALVVSPGVREALLCHPWPGNARELISEIESLARQAPEDGVIGTDLLNRDVRRSCAPIERARADHLGKAGLTARLEAIKEAEVLDALERRGGNRTKAAQDLGLTLRGLSKILARLRARGRLSL